MGYFQKRKEKKRRRDEIYTKVMALPRGEKQLSLWLTGSNRYGTPGTLITPLKKNRQRFFTVNSDLVWRCVKLYEPRYNPEWGMNFYTQSDFVAHVHSRIGNLFS